MGGAGCPNCHCANRWMRCTQCGNTICGGCGTDMAGRRSRAANVCAGCGRTGTLCPA